MKMTKKNEIPQRKKLINERILYKSKFPSFSKTCMWLLERSKEFPTFSVTDIQRYTLTNYANSYNFCSNLENLELAERIVSGSVVLFKLKENNKHFILSDYLEYFKKTLSKTK